MWLKQIAAAGALLVAACAENPNGVFRDEGTGALTPPPQQLAKEIVALDLENALVFDPELATVHVQPAADLSNRFPDPGNQGTQGSGAAWGVAAVATYARARREFGQPTWASPSYL